MRDADRFVLVSMRWRVVNLLFKRLIVIMIGGMFPKADPSMRGKG
jgi:hypothetical protein